MSANAVVDRRERALRMPRKSKTPVKLDRIRHTNRSMAEFDLEELHSVSTHPETARILVAEDETIATTVTFGVYGAMALKRELDLFELTKKQFGEVLGFELAERVAEGWKRRGSEAATEFLDSVDSRDKDVRTRWVFQNAPAGSGHAAQLTGHQWDTISKLGFLSWLEKDSTGKESYRT